MTRFNNTMIFFKFKNHRRIETRCLENLLIFIQTLNNKFNVSDHIRISTYKNVLAKGHVPNWSEEVMFY